MSNDVLTHAGPPACENCTALLQGQFCHQCGQSSHNPLRNLGHAIEEVFESFWHLDGRIFRTLRALWSPGRLANSYLSGHRAPYVAPLRLFVILSVLTFFLAQYAVSFGEREAEGGTGNTAEVNARNAFNDAKTAEEVIQDRDDAIRGLWQGKAAVQGIPGAATGFDRSVEAMRKQARERIKELDPKHPELRLPVEQTGPVEDSVEDAPSAQDKVAPEAAQADSAAAKPAPKVTVAGHTLGKPSADSGFFQRWLDKKGQRASDNWERFQKDPELMKHAIMGAIPTALFFLVPIFAIFLKLAYIETHRSYLEHLVVALYSHAWLCLALLTLCVLVMLDNWISPYAAWVGVVIGVIEFVIWWWMPIYLLIMQKRVYAQAWWLTVLKYLIIGTVYLVLVAFAAAFVGISSFIN
ncbi:DUF3667 domain-containing protein [Pseudoxanthomonas indica]|uniref:DUF3667 domain-containing protein n=1 Tax=Pseudoxanthomonas indica TaxID=428993 RepID=A0A1T5KEW3_9GAMM|nr:DUF3667 domain-containing protein [Pseudoxanthomonas indica]GGD48852.1 hypothetical protein GCM10007235_20980 [Pseudoxanthomonas indica]SKC62069.1 Protein of unknown function [Pseudoxanthomonas indica]